MLFTLADTVTPTITSEMLKPLVDGVIANVGVVLPIGLTLFALFIGIKVVPMIIRNFLHG